MEMEGPSTGAGRSEAHADTDANAAGPFAIRRQSSGITVGAACNLSLRWVPLASRAHSGCRQHSALMVGAPDKPGPRWARALPGVQGSGSSPSVYPFPRAGGQVGVLPGAVPGSMLHTPTPILPGFQVVHSHPYLA
eukprot:349741-Chlamydomonas_euryale.AAC.8